MYIPTVSLSNKKHFASFSGLTDIFVWLQEFCFLITNLTSFIYIKTPSQDQLSHILLLSFFQK